MLGVRFEVLKVFQDKAYCSSFSADKLYRMNRVIKLNIVDTTYKIQISSNRSSFGEWENMNSVFHRYLLDYHILQVVILHARHQHGPLWLLYNQHLYWWLFLIKARHSSHQETRRQRVEKSINTKFRHSERIAQSRLALSARLTSSELILTLNHINNNRSHL